MVVLVTGATGFVGSAVVRALRADGHEVTALVRDPARASAVAATGAQPARGDMLEPGTYVPLVAARTPWCTPPSWRCRAG